MADKLDELDELNEPNKNSASEPAQQGPVDASVSVQIDRGGMIAQVMLTAPRFGGSVVDFDMLTSALDTAGVKHGISNDMLKRLAHIPEYDRWVEVAHASAPVHGDEAKLDFTFNLERNMQPKERPDGTVDYRDLDIVANVRTGDILCVRTPATSGIPGTTVTGNTIPAKPGHDRPVPAGKNTKVSEDGLTLFSAISGQPHYDGSKISVLSVFEVPEDVGLATGNVSFVGDVVVKGSVAVGFKVEADGDIDVYGVVEGGTLISRGNVTVRSGMKKNASVKAEGSVTTRFVESSSVYSGGNIIAESLIHSKVTCRGDITLSGGKGIIMGGHILAGRSIEARTIGSDSAAPPLIEISADPELLQKERFLKQSLTELKPEIDKLDSLMDLFEQYADMGRLTPDKEEQMRLAKAKLVTSLARKQEAEDELSYIAVQLVWQDRGFIRCSERIFHGTKLQMGKSVLVIENNMDHCRFVCRENKIIPVSF